MKHHIIYLLLIIAVKTTFSQLTFNTHIIQNISMDGARTLFAIDLDNDNDIDVIYASEYGQVSWFENFGNGNFSSQQVLTDTAVGAISVFAIDLDNDGDNDILSASQWDNKIAWYENYGNGNFSSQKIIYNYAWGAISVISADLDNDLDNDVIHADINFGKIIWHANDGNGNFGIAQSISETTSFMKSVIAFDLDYDNDLDIIGPEGQGISWNENNGLGIFTADQVITSSIIGGSDICAADINEDGYKDIVSSSYNDNKIAWYVNDGTGNFGSQQIISTTNFGPLSIFTIDLDNDGDIDVVSTSFDNRIAYYLNSGNGTFSAMQIISHQYNGAYSVFSIDIDNDGDNDVLSSHYFNSVIVWYENSLLNNVDTIEICEGDSVEILGNWTDTTGKYYDTLQNYLGGDSINIYTVIVSLLPTITFEPGFPDSIGINSVPINLPNVTPTGGTFSGAGISGSFFDPTIVNLGTYWISYFYTDPNTGCSNSDSVQITVFDGTGIENPAIPEIEIFPNPTFGKFTIVGKNMQSAEIWDITGELVYQKSKLLKNPEGLHNIDISNQKKGIYFVKVVVKGFVVFRKLILI
ncbi:MAG: VCBS repeat-containing protein [Bacteroidetes bacterium]|jgi:hypothetical protein|nr:VCBS repeat-containing protein [Bacteroidota bacterium]MBT6685453.1 VCBS repeat-containing protein [Bacteroidota bacterium]MBT7490550.1 VCBS repeat-containing protein [Bacteroidota bacterium]